MGMTWVLLALTSAVFTSARYLYIKKWCSRVPSSILVFATRIFGSLILLFSVLPHGIHLSDPGRFFPVLGVTVVLTIIATLANIKIVQTDSLSGNVPYLSFIPIFMIPWTIVLLHESPSALALAGILITCAGAYLLNLDRTLSPFAPFAAIIRRKNARIMLLVAVALGCTTACDRIAIAASSAAAYSFIWTVASAAAMVFVAGAHHHRSEITEAIRNRHVFIQAVLWSGSFLSQMAGVQAALHIPSGVTYVKTVTMVNIIFTVAAGGAVFGELKMKRSITASILMVLGAIIVVMGK